jgi:deazaflavin-dependent oxidoreductase (nitroreductase family)
MGGHYQLTDQNGDRVLAMTPQARSPLRSRFGRAATRLANVVLAPIARQGWIPFWGLVEHVGRKSGRRYRTPVAILRAGDRLVIPVPFGLGTQWVQNVLAASGATLHWQGRDVPVDDARIVPWSEVKPLVRRSLGFAVRLTRIRDMLSVRP